MYGGDGGVDDVESLSVRREADEEEGVGEGEVDHSKCTGGLMEKMGRKIGPFPFSQQSFLGRKQSHFCHILQRGDTIAPHSAPASRRKQSPALSETMPHSCPILHRRILLHLHSAGNNSATYRNNTVSILGTHRFHISCTISLAIDCKRFYFYITPRNNAGRHNRSKHYAKL